MHPCKEFKQMTHSDLMHIKVKTNLHIKPLLCLLPKTDLGTHTSALLYVFTLEQSCAQKLSVQYLHCIKFFENKHLNSLMNYSSLRSFWYKDHLWISPMSSFKPWSLTVTLLSQRRHNAVGRSRRTNCIFTVCLKYMYNISTACAALYSTTAPLSVKNISCIKVNPSST